MQSLVHNEEIKKSLEDSKPKHNRDTEVIKTLFFFKKNGYSIADALYCIARIRDYAVNVMSIPYLAAPDLDLGEQFRFAIPEPTRRELCEKIPDCTDSRLDALSKFYKYAMSVDYKIFSKQHLELCGFTLRAYLAEYFDEIELKCDRRDEADIAGMVVDEIDDLFETITVFDAERE